MQRLSSVTASIVAILVMAAPVGAGVDDRLGQTADEAATPRAWGLIDELRMATARYHDVSVAMADGFEPFALDGSTEPTCFDGPDGGMGVHYVKGVDDRLDPSRPEALVYELTPGGERRLVAVEYVVPAEHVEDGSGIAGTMPRVLGQPLHKHATLPLYVLHAWIWEENPTGLFADFNPRLGPCPA